MSYIRQMYLDKQKEIEYQALENQTNGVQARFICNKIIKKYFRDLNKNGMLLTCNRLNRLVQLVDILYRKENQGKFLIKDSYCISRTGLYSATALFNYSYLTEDIVEIRQTFANNEKLYQEQSEKVVGELLNTNIDRIISQVLLETRYIETFDLRDVLNSKSIQELRTKCPEYGDIPLPQEIVTELFQDFDYEKIPELNESERVKL